MKDRVDSKEVMLATKTVWGDYFTKLLQGELFRKMRVKVMNIDLTNP